MSLPALPAPGRLGEELYQLAARLFPICRSITGEGVRQTLRILGEQVNLEIREVPSGTRVFDWTVPQEWHLREAWVKGPDGRTVVDFRDSNLHVVSYSVPVRARMPLTQLRPHLHSLPDQPTLIPYRTSYYARDWGFCLPHERLAALPDGEYEVLIDADLRDGHLTYGECVVPGETGEEVLVSAHTCHPSLANDNLSGVVVAALLARELAAAPAPPRYTYRFVFAPGTIGAITWLARNETRTSRIRHGLVLACLGDPGHVTYKRSRRGDAGIDRAVAYVLARSGRPHRVEPFTPYGYDERQYCSPGFNLPVGCLTRTPYARYPEYHTSADDLSLIRPECLEDSLRVAWEAFEVLEADRRYLNLNPKCEPQLGRRGLYGHLGGRSDAQERQLAMLWVLNLSDGEHSLLDVAERSGLPMGMLAEVAGLLVEAGLLAPA